MFEVSQQPRQYCLTWPGWRLEFRWQTDRWQHILWRQRGTGWAEAITSVEGSSEQTWPPSPVFQNVYFEEISPDIAEFQVLGQAGKSHYSGAIRYDDRLHSLDFDLAVRLQAPPQGPLLLSTYDISAQLGPGSSEDWKLTTETLAAQPALRAAWQSSNEPSQSRLILEVDNLQGVKIDKQRTTLRWKYQWTMKPIA